MSSDHRFQQRSNEQQQRHLCDNTAQMWLVRPTGEPGTVMVILSAALGGRCILMGCQHNAVANVGEADLRWPRG